ALYFWRFSSPAAIMADREYAVRRHADIIAVGPGRMGARTDTFRQYDAANGACCDILGINQHAFRLIRIYVGDKRYQITVVFILGIDARCKRSFACVAAGTEFNAFILAGFKVMFDKPAEQEPAGFRDGAIGVAIFASGIFLVEHTEFDNLVA